MFPYFSELNKNIDYDPTEKTYSENGWGMKYRRISHNQVYVELTKTNQGNTPMQENALIMAGHPLKIAFPQTIPVRMNVGNGTYGYGNMRFSTNNGIYLFSTAYGNSITWTGYGVITVE